MRVKVALLIPDNRDEFKNYAELQPRFGPAPTALLEGFARIPECEIHVVCCVHQPMAAPEKLADKIWYHQLLVPKWGWRLGYLGCVWALRRKLRQLRPEIVHGQGTERYCALSAALSGLPNLITIHGNMRAIAKALRAKVFSFGWLTALLETVALARTNGVICLTNYTKRQVGNLTARTWVVPNAVDSTFFAVGRQSDPRPTLVCAANADVYKNQLGLIKALDQLACAQSIHLVFAGKVSPEDAYGAELLRLCAERSWCKHEGPLDVAQLKELLGRATALILPSLEDNCPMVVLEAMAARVPVAASRIGGIPDLIEDGVTGFLFDPRDQTSIRTTVEGLLSDPARAKRLCEAARERAKLRFLPEVVARRHLEIYRELLSAADV